jgi:hypothetical protein
MGEIMTNLRKALDASYESELKFASDRIGDAWDNVDWCGVFDPTKPLLEINPEPRPWVGLTDEEIDRLEDAIDPAMYRVFARRVEQLLKERNDALRPHNPPA